MPSPQMQSKSSSSLVFITQTGPGRRKEQQTLIRKHVMKDIGKSRRKEKRNDKPNTLHFTLQIPDSFQHFNSAPEIDELKLKIESAGIPLLSDDYDLNETTESLFSTTGEALLSDDAAKRVAPKWQPQYYHAQVGLAPAALRIERIWTGRMDPFVNYPIKMTRRTLELMDHIFDDRYGNTPPFRNAWLPVGMMNAASFHQVLSNAAMNLAALKAKDTVPEQTESMMHHTTAIKLVTEQITDQGKATSDGVIATIIGFACYSHVTGKQKQWQMHMNAVKELIKLRGGIETLYSNPLLRVVLLWVDVGGAVTEDIQPHFALPLEIIPAQADPETIQNSPLPYYINNSWRSALSDKFEIIYIMQDIRSYSVLLKQEVARTDGAIWSDGTFAAYGILPLLHRLLSIPLDSNDDQQQKLNIVRLGCILYFAEIRRRFGIMGIIPYYQTKKLQSLLVQQGDDWGSLEILKTWVLALASIESTGIQRGWFFERLRISKERIAIESWEELESRFSEILWYDVIHSAMFANLLSGIENMERWDSRERLQMQ